MLAFLLFENVCLLSRGVRDVFDGNAFSCILLEVAFDVIVFKINVPGETVMDHDPLGAVFALALNLGDLDAVDKFFQ